MDCRGFVLAGALAGAMAAAATPGFAQSKPALPDLPSLDDVEAVLPDLAGGLYLRGTIAASVSNWGAVKKSDASALPSGVIGRAGFDQPVGAEFGVGYGLGSWVRLEATVERRFGGEFFATQAWLEGGAPRAGRWSGDVASTLLMANASIDLVTWNGLTPFVGVGIGAAWTDVHGVAYADALSTGSARGRGQWSLAWAAMAGVAYDLAPGVRLELSYRYLDLGDARSGVAACACGAAPLRLRDMAVGDVRLGLRWTLAGG